MSIPIWTWGPSETTYTERLQWQTRIHVSADGSEDRERTRLAPRRFTSWVHRFLDVGDRRSYDQTRYEHGAGPYVVPLWWDSVPVISIGIGAGNTNFQITFEDYSTREFIVGAMAAAKNSRDEWVYGEITNIVTNEGSNVAVVLIEGEIDIGSFATAGINLYPAGVAKLSPSTASTSITSHYEQIAVAFEYKRPAPLPAAASGESFESINVFPYRPNQSPGWQEVDQNFGSDRIDNGLGVWSTLDEVGEPLDVRTQEYRFINDRESLWLYKRFLQRQGGRHLEFWAPSWNADLEVTGITAGVNPGDPYTITIAGEIDWGTYYTGRDSRECVYLRTRDGDQAGRITAATVGTGETTLTVDFEDPLATTDVSKVIQCHWLELVRLAFDDVTITHRTTEVAFMRLSLKQLKETA